MIYFPLERIQSVPIREIPLSREPSTRNNELSMYQHPSCSPYMPLVHLLIPLRCRDRLIQHDIAIQIQFRPHKLEIALNLFMAWVMLAPRPVLVDLGDAERVDGPLRVDSRTRV